jgi:ABC-type Mn2+/Zn2+ transport system permease subunit
VIPGAVAFLFTNRFGLALILAWVAGFIAIVGGIAASFLLDLATGPLLVCSFGAVLVLAFVLRRIFSVHTGRDVVVAGLTPPSDSGGVQRRPAG